MHVEACKLVVGKGTGCVQPGTSSSKPGRHVQSQRSLWTVKAAPPNTLSVWAKWSSCTAVTSWDSDSVAESSGSHACCLLGRIPRCTCSPADVACRAAASCLALDARATSSSFPPQSWCFTGVVSSLKKPKGRTRMVPVLMGAQNLWLRSISIASASTSVNAYWQA